MKIKFILLAILCWIQLNGAQSPLLDFSDRSFDTFLNQVVQSDHRQEFAIFYKNFDDQQKKMSASKKEKYLEELRKSAYASLEVKYQQWANAIKPYLKTTNSDNLIVESEQNTRIFLVRYGVYEEFLKQKALSRATAWKKMRSYVNDMSKKVVNWFGSWKKPKAA